LAYASSSIARLSGNASICTDPACLPHAHLANFGLGEQKMQFLPWPGKQSLGSFFRPPASQACPVLWLFRNAPLFKLNGFVLWPK